MDVDRLEGRLRTDPLAADRPSTSIQVDTHLGGEMVIDVVGEDGPAVLLVRRRLTHLDRLAGQIRVPTQNRVAKLGFPHASGRIAWYRSDGVRLIQDTQREDGASYPDDGCQVELWLQHPLTEPLPELGGFQPDAHLVELETLSPLRTLSRGDSVSLTVNWRCDVAATSAALGSRWRGAARRWTGRCTTR